MTKIIKMENRLVVVRVRDRRVDERKVAIKGQ